MKSTIMFLEVKNTQDEINSKGNDKYLETWQQKLQNKHTGKKRNQSKSKQSFKELQGNNS